MTLQSANIDAKIWNKFYHARTDPGDCSPPFPPSGPVTDSFKGLHPQSNFLAAIDNMMQRRFIAVVLVGGCLLQVATGDMLEQVDLPKLIDPATRKAEVVGMLARQDEATKQMLKRGDFTFKRRDFRLVTCPQRDGRQPLQMLLVDHGEMLFKHPTLPDAYEADGLDELFPTMDKELVDKSSTTGPGLERLGNYVITIFDPDGQEIRPFGGNTMIDSGHVADFNRDGIMDRLDRVNYGVEDRQNVRVLELRSVEREPRQILTVIYNWHPREAEEANAWDYECFDEDKDGLIEIGFGPRDQERRREVVFRWDKTKATYIAKDLATQPRLRVLDDTDIQKQLKAIKDAGGHRYPLLAAKAGHPVEVSIPPKPFQFQSLKGRSDEEIVRAMGGKPAPDAFHPADAPDTHLPEGFWKMEPKAAALAFAEANRMPAHRQMFRIAIDDRNDVRPPAAGWLVHDFKSSGCYVSTTSMTVLRFGIEKPYIFQSGTSKNGMVGANPLADRAGHALRLIPVSQDEARFLSETLFWLDRIRTRSSKDDPFGGGPFGGDIISSADGSGTLDFQGGNQEPRRVAGRLWLDPSLASRWKNDYDQNTCINLADYLLTDALPKHLIGRWDTTPQDHRSLITPLADRVKPREDSAARDELAFIVLAALERHRTDPWPAAALARLVNCAGDSGLPQTLPVLEEINGKLAPPSSLETEFRGLEVKFTGRYGSPNDAEGKQQWERYQSLRRQMAYDIPCQLREPLARAIKQLGAIFEALPLVKMAEANDASAAWALQQLQIYHPKEYADTLIVAFRDADPKSRGMIFSTLAAAYPEGAKLLRETLTAQQAAALAIELASFEQKKEPELAKSRIPELLEIAKDAVGIRDYGERGPAIELLSALPLDEAQRAKFEELLLAELKTPQRRPFKISILPWITTALVKLPDPDRYWDALVQGAEQATEFGEFYGFLNALSTLALANPEKRMGQLVDFIRPCFTRHEGMMNDLFAVALSLDLRGLAPEIQHLASTGPDVPDGECANGLGGKFTGPENNRYHFARHVIALWQESDADTLARMWLALVIAHPGDFARTSIIAVKLRERFRSALAAASPEVREKLTTQTRKLSNQSPYLLEEPK